MIGVSFGFEKTHVEISPEQLFFEKDFYEVFHILKPKIINKVIAQKNQWKQLKLEFVTDEEKQLVEEKNNVLISILSPQKTGFDNNEQSKKYLKNILDDNYQEKQIDCGERSIQSFSDNNALYFVHDAIIFEVRIAMSRQLTKKIKPLMEIVKIIMSNYENPEKS